MLGGLAGLLGLAAGDDRGLAGGAQALLDLLEALEREVQLGLHGHDALVGRGGPGTRGLGGLAGARELGPQELEAARGALGDVADLGQLGAQRGAALVGDAAVVGKLLAGLENALAEAVDMRADGVDALAARGQLGLERGGALIDGARGARPAPPPRRAPRRGTRRRAAGRCACVVRLELAPGGGALLAGAGGVLAGGRGGLAGGGGDLTGAERLGLGACGLAPGDLELAAEAGDQVAQLLGVGAAALLRALGERDRLVDQPRAARGRRRARCRRRDRPRRSAAARPRRPRAPAGRCRRPRAS